MSASIVWRLVRKEFAQLLRTKRALITAVLMPAFFMVVFPLQQIVFFRPSPPATLTVRPSVIHVNTAGPPPTVCVQLKSAAGSPIANTLVNFSVNGTPAGPNVTTDSSGGGCVVYSVQLQPGSYDLTASTPFLREGVDASGARLEVAGPEPRSYLILSSPPPAVAGGFLNFKNPSDVLVAFLLPFMIFIAASIAPLTFAVQTVLLERERRSLDLLLALPVTVQEVLASKVAFTVLSTLSVLLPLFLVDAAAVLLAGLEGAGYVLAALVLLLASVSASAAFTLVVALLTRELRTANNTVGFLSLPAIVVVGVILFLVPPPWSLLLASALMLAVAGFAYWAATSWITFERYLE